MRGESHNQRAIAAAERLIERLGHHTLNEAEAARLEAALDSRMQFASPNPYRAGFLHEDGDLRVADWAARVASDNADVDVLEVDLGERDVAMSGARATGTSLVSNGHLGVDVIRIEAGAGFEPHTHPGDHLLIVIGGSGTVAYGGAVYPTQAGDVYLIEGAIPHAVSAITDHVILAIGAPHRAVDSPDRQTVVAYRDVAAEMGDLTCRICGITAHYPARLADVGCPHCPSGAEPRGAFHSEPAVGD